MSASQTTLYIVYSQEKPNLSENCALLPTHSPMQNYSELYVQKEVWKQMLPDSNMVGFFHMRRYLDLSHIYQQVELSHRLKPYGFQKFPCSDKYKQDFLSAQLSHYDIIAPIPEQTGVRVSDRYAQYAHQRSSDLDAVITILCEKYPDYASAAEHYLAGTKEFYGNIYIMSGSYFTEYAQWLFDLLSEFDARVTDQLPRTPGYLSERLFGIWLTKKMSEGSAKIGFAPRIHFYGYDGTTHHFKRDMYISLLFPAGSKRRLYLRNLIH